jgi:hypothetical protein
MEDPGTRVLFPFWIRRRDAYQFRHFAAGFRPPPISEDLAARLMEAGVLVTWTEYHERRQSFEAVLQKACPQFEKQGYCELPGLMHPAHAIALASYYEALAACGDWKLGDEQVSLRHGWHNEHVSRYFHYQVTDILSRAAGEPVRPSYAYVSAYRPGAVLKPHVDRRQCVFTLSVLIECPPANGTERWPLWFQTHEGNVSVTQSSGDGGCELPHWRDRPPGGDASATLIFHYVPQDFRGVID